MCLERANSTGSPLADDERIVVSVSERNCHIPMLLVKVLSSSRLYTYGWKAIIIKDKGMQHLPTGQWVHQPSAPPPGLLPLTPFLAPNPAFILSIIICKFCGLCKSIYGNCYPQLIIRVYGQHKTCKTSTHRGCQTRSKSLTRSLVSLTKRFGFWCK
jgi:hypothetical protein